MSLIFKRVPEFFVDASLSTWGGLGMGVLHREQTCEDVLLEFILNKNKYYNMIKFCIINRPVEGWHELGMN